MFTFQLLTTYIRFEVEALLTTLKPSLAHWWLFVRNLSPPPPLFTAYLRILFSVRWSLSSPLQPLYYLHPVTYPCLASSAHSPNLVFLQDILSANKYHSSAYSLFTYLIVFAIYRSDPALTRGWRRRRRRWVWGCCRESWVRDSGPSNSWPWQLCRSPSGSACAVESQPPSTPQSCKRTWQQVITRSL